MFFLYRSGYPTHYDFTNRPRPNYHLTGSLQNGTVAVDLTLDIPPQTAALVIIKLQYEDALVYQTVEVQTVLSD